jgi:hypothetical protein
MYPDLQGSLAVQTLQSRFKQESPKIAGRMSASTFEHTKRRFFMSEVLGWGCKKLREKREKGWPGQE